MGYTAGKASEIQWGRYFCEHLQIQAFAQQIGYVIYATVIKI